VQVPISPGLGDIEKGVGGDLEQSHSYGGGGGCSVQQQQQQHGQGHVRWRSPLRVAGRELERYVDVEEVGGTWSRDDEETPLIGGGGEEGEGGYVGYGCVSTADGSGDEVSCAFYSISKFRPFFSFVFVSSRFLRIPKPKPK